MKNLNEIAQKADEAISSTDQGCIESLVQELILRLERKSKPNEECLCHYILANLYSGLFSILKESASGWREDNYPNNLTSQINHLRSAEALISDSTRIYKNEIRTNLANAIAMQRRNIEVLDHWKCDFTIPGDAPFVSSRSKAKELIWISRWLNDPSHRELYKAEAYFLLKELKENLSKTDHSEIIDSLTTDDEIVLFLREGESSFESLKNWQHKHVENKCRDDEKKYRAWCLKNRLFANPINDLTTEWIADQDILQFPNHIVSLASGPFLSAAFSSLKREYCFARFMAYEGIHKLHPAYENQKLFLTDTLDYVHYSGSIEKLKASFRICFSVFDSIAFLMNHYFKCNSKSVSFSSRWIKDNLKDQEENFFIDALYWLACDLTDNPGLTSDPNKWKAPNPQAAEIRAVRNAIEHSWLRVAETEQSVWDSSNDFAYVVTPDVLERHTLFVLKLVRAAMLYLCFAVTFNEKKSKKNDNYTPSFPITLVGDDLIAY